MFETISDKKIIYSINGMIPLSDEGKQIVAETTANIRTELERKIRIKNKGVFPNWGYADTPPMCMKDAEYAETNEKPCFRVFQFIFFELSWKFIKNWDVLRKSDHNSKNKNLKTDFSFISARSAYFM